MGLWLFVLGQSGDLRDGRGHPEPRKQWPKQWVVTLLGGGKLKFVILGYFGDCYTTYCYLILSKDRFWADFLGKRCGFVLRVSFSLNGLLESYGLQYASRAQVAIEQHHIFSLLVVR